MLKFNHISTQKTYMIQSALGRSLDVKNGRAKEGNGVQLYDKNATFAQQWDLIDAGNGYCYIRSKLGYFLDVKGANKHPGAEVQIWVSTSSDAQLWKLILGDEGNFHIQSKLGTYLEVHGRGSANGALLLMSTKKDTTAQKWKFYRIPSALYLSNFKPHRDGFNFVNDFQNNVISGIDVRTSGLCGGMSYTALDYYFSRRAIPSAPFRPAEGTTLHRYIYKRQVSSIIDNLDKWAELTFNPFGVRDSEFANWGLEGRLNTLRNHLRSKRPIALCLSDVEGRIDKGHQVVAIGMDLGRFSPRTKQFSEDVKIFLYDPNYPNRMITMVPDMARNCWEYLDEDQAYRTYFIDERYKRKLPPVLPKQTATQPGLVHELLVNFCTGSDDLRGGNDNVNLRVDYADRTYENFLNLNNSQRWIDNYDHTVSLILTKPHRLPEIKSITLSTTFKGGSGGDNWNLQKLKITAKGLGVNKMILDKKGDPFFRFTGKKNNLPISIG
ncbi:RICIN domain-containing protein [Algoriphagus sp.]|uniref:RICIN domain-containing protein n=1 Tax=Algoriphagus sp. TaxID=1872435 RepID=UPI0026265D8E|nr:RICIN domain-containing protein [Algoriphagus sp.]